MNFRQSSVLGKIEAAKLSWNNDERAKALSIAQQLLSEIRSGIEKRQIAGRVDQLVSQELRELNVLHAEVLILTGAHSIQATC